MEKLQDSLLPSFLRLLIKRISMKRGYFTHCHKKKAPCIHNHILLYLKKKKKTLLLNFYHLDVRTPNLESFRTPIFLVNPLNRKILILRSELTRKNGVHLWKLPQSSLFLIPLFPLMHPLSLSLRH